jgi:hypothetical protein
MVGGCGTVHITLGAMFVGAALYVDYKNDRKRKQLERPEEASSRTPKADYREGRGDD